MGNIKKAYVRLFPVYNKIKKTEFWEIFNDFKKQLTGLWFYFNESENCIEIVYSGKRVLNMDFFTDKRIIEHYHIWIRVADIAYHEDMLGFKSKHFHTSNVTIDNKCKWNIGFSNDWNFATSCLYSADEILIRFNTKKSSYLKKLLKSNKYGNINDIINKDLLWKYKLMITYLKGSQTILENIHNEEPVELDYYSSTNAWCDGDVRGILTNEKLIQIKQEFLDQLFKHDNDAKPIRFEKTIE